MDTRIFSPLLYHLSYLASEPILSTERTAQSQERRVLHAGGRAAWNGPIFKGLLVVAKDDRVVVFKRGVYLGFGPLQSWSQRCAGKEER